jgi:hypothetical protein
MRLRLIPGLLIMAASALHAEVEIRTGGDRVSVHAVSAPISEILASLARQTGMRLTYDAPLPRQSLTATLEDRTPAEVVLSVLEGLGLNYALVMDRSGSKVDQLLILGTLVGIATPERPTPAEAGLEEADPESKLDPMEVMRQIAVEEEAHARAARSAAPNAAPSAGPHPPEYPSSAFTPRLPLPTPPETPSPQPTPPTQGDQ